MKFLTPGTFAGFAVIVSIGFALYGVWLGADGTIWKAAGLGCAAITLFSTRSIPEIVTAFGIFLAALLLGVVPKEVVFAGLTSEGFWLLVSGIILGAAISATGLARQISQRLILLSGPSYPRAVLIIAAAGMLLGVLIPSTMPRIMVMIPIAAALAAQLDLEPEGRGAIGLIATASAATLLPTYAILTANLPTIVQVGAMAGLYDVHSTYSAYFQRQLPVNILRFALLVILMIGFHKTPVRARKEKPKAIALTPEQRRLICVLGAAILAWMSDFLHGVSPARVALCAATLVIWPRFGMLGPKAMKEQIDLSPAIFFASIMTVVAVARGAGLDLLLADRVISVLPLDDSGGLASVYGVFGFSLTLAHLTTAPAAPAVLVPFAQSLSQATNLPLDVISMIQVIGISTPVIPYQAPPLIVAMSLSKVANGVFLRICLWLTLAVTLAGIPATFLWWHLIGFL